MDTGYAPSILRNMVEICAAMGVGRETVMKWIEQGAPIAVEYIGRKPSYSCEAVALQKWRFARSGKGGGNDL